MIVATHGARPSFTLHPLALVAGFAAFVVAAHNDRLWREVFDVWPGRAPGDWAFFASIAILIFATVAVPLQLAAFPRLLKPVLAFLALLAALISHFADNYGVMVDKTMIANIVGTDMHEAGDLLAWPLARHFVLTGLLPAALIAWVPLRQNAWKREAALRTGALVASFAALALIAGLFYQDYASLLRNNRQLRHMVNPVTAIYSSVAYAAAADPISGPPVPVGADAARQADPGRKPMFFVLVVGETARAADFGLTGYSRETTPELAKLPVAAHTATSCGTSTAESVPCIFSAFGRAGFSVARARASENLLDLLIHAGFKVRWLENNAGCKGVCDRVETENLSSSDDPEFCSGGECLDGILVGRLEELVAEARDNTVVVLHQMGSHGPAYFRRYPAAFRKFEPTCDTAQIQTCARAEIVNSYDNSILYTDHVLAAAIGTLERAGDRFETSLVYTSDHGESLGERGTYLHGLPYAIAPDVQTHVPLVAWVSTSLGESIALDFACLRAAPGVELSHDNVFHIVIGLLGIATEVYRPASDPFAHCRAGGR